MSKKNYNLSLNDDGSFISVCDVWKHFTIGKNTLSVLKGVSFSVSRGEWVTLYGASGSGKTTLLDVIGTISRPDKGLVMVGGADVNAMSGGSLVDFRRRHVGFVFQSYHILPELNILENVMLPSLLDGRGRRACREKALSLLDKVGLSGRLDHRSGELSGGEQQRAAIARALMNDPEIILADEPTGNLDSVTGRGVLELFRSIREAGTTILMVTHDRSIASLADRTVCLADGRIQSEEDKEEDKTEKQICKEP